MVSLGTKRARGQQLIQQPHGEGSRDGGVTKNGGEQINTGELQRDKDPKDARGLNVG